MSYDALNDDQRSGTTPNGKISYTIDQAAAQLDRAGLSWSPTLGQAATVTYAYRASAPATMPDDTAGFQQFSTQQINATETALALWARVANITFVRVNDGNGYSNNATILFGDYTSGESGSDAFAILPGNRAAGSATGDVWVNSSYSDNYNVLDRNDFGFLTLLHEIGHSIGLLHPSDYDSTNDNSNTITYARDASYFEDSLEYSVMSYFDIAYTGGYEAADAPSTPLIDDIAAAQRLYGANMSTNSGNTIYGDNRNGGAIGLTGAGQYLVANTWGTIWDGGGIDTLDFSQSGSGEKIDLHAGAFSDVDGGIGNLSIAKGVTIENAIGGAYNDVLIGNDADNILNGGGGDDLLRGNGGGDTYIGGAGADRAVLNGNVWDYSLLAGTAGDVLDARNGSGNQYIDASTEIVQFQNGQYLALKDLPAYMSAALPSGVNVVVAPLSGTNRVDGTSAYDWLALPGRASDYTLTRVQSSSGVAVQGDFQLSSKLDGSVIDIGERIDVIQFRNGQYLAITDLPAYVGGSGALMTGGAQDDVLLQTRPGGYELLSGGAGTDAAYLKGNVGDYALQAFSGDTGDFSSPLFGGTGYAGWALVGRNGSGTVFIDQSVEIVHFQNGQYLSFADLPAYIGATGASYGGDVHLLPDADPARGATFYGTVGGDRALLNGNASDYTLSRDGSDAFVLTPKAGSAADSTIVALRQTIDTVQFLNGQYLSLVDLGAYVQGSEVATSGTSADDLLYADYSGNQLLIGRGGYDTAYIHGNVADYVIKPYSGNTDPFGYSYTGGPYSGELLVARNGTGTLYIDSSTEAVHFQNGQYLSYNDLTAYIAGA